MTMKEGISATPAIPQAQSFDLSGPKIILEGDSGAGKTFALGTLVDWAQKNGFKVRALFTENGLETLLGYWRDKGLQVPECLAWHEVQDRPLDLKALTDQANKVGLLSYKALTEMTDPERGLNNAYEKLLRVLADFPDDRTGVKLGNIGTWNSDTIFIIDSLTELGELAMKMVVGKKPTASPSDFGVTQNNLMNLLRYLTQGYSPTLVMTAHIQRQVNEITGGQNLMVKAPGKALGDDIPRLFSEVIYSRREGAEWLWSTASIGVNTKTRYLPISEKIRPDFSQVMDKWLKRGKAT